MDLVKIVVRHRRVDRRKGERGDGDADQYFT
jgi:hypothetical protein